MDKLKITGPLNDVMDNIQEAIDMVEDLDLDMAIHELEIAQGSIETQLKELRKEES